MKKWGRAYGTVISNYGSEELKKVFDTHISKEKRRFEQFHIPNDDKLFLLTGSVPQDFIVRISGQTKF